MDLSKIQKICLESLFKAMKLKEIGSGKLADMLNEPADVVQRILSSGHAKLHNILKIEFILDTNIRNLPEISPPETRQLDRGTIDLLVRERTAEDIISLVKLNLANPVFVKKAELRRVDPRDNLIQFLNNFQSSRKQPSGEQFSGEQPSGEQYSEYSESDIPSNSGSEY